jgi:dihydroneopterin aldolase
MPGFAAAPIDLLSNSVMLEVEDVDIDIRTGVYPAETHRPQPLRISARAWLRIPRAFRPDTGLDASIDYIRLRQAIIALPVDLHFTLVEAVADALIAAIFRIDARIAMAEVRVVKLALSTEDQKIGIRVRRTKDDLTLSTFG